MRHVLGPGLLVVAVAVTAWPRSAGAATCPSNPVSTCINDDTFWPHAGPAQLATVGGTETVAARQISFGLVTSYLSRPITMHVPSPGPDGTDQNVVNDQVNGTFLWAYGVTRQLQLDFALPVTFGQGGSGAAGVTGGSALSDTALRDLRFGLAYGIVPRFDKQKPWSLAARMEFSAPTGDKEQFAGERTLVPVPSVATDLRLGRFFAGLEIGARLRPTAEFLGARVGTQLLGGLGAGVDILPRDLLAVSAEARALYGLAEQRDAQQTSAGIVSTKNGQHITPAEWMVAVRTAPLAGGDLGFQLGGGGAIPTGADGDAPITTPRFRFVLGIRYAPLGRDQDKDGVLDRNDECPSEPGTAETHGCPKPPEAPPAKKAARLSLRPPAGTTDRCTDDPDTVDGFRAKDGCPDEDADQDGVDDRHDRCPQLAEDYAGLADGCPR